VRPTEAARCPKEQSGFAAYESYGPSKDRRRIQQLQERVPGARYEDAGTPGLAPYPLIRRAGLGAVIVPGKKLSLVDPQLPVEKVQLLHASVRVRRIFPAARQAHQHAHHALFVVVVRRRTPPRCGAQGVAAASLTASACPAPRRVGLSGQALRGQRRRERIGEQTALPIFQDDVHGVQDKTSIDRFWIWGIDARGRSATSVRPARPQRSRAPPYRRALPGAHGSRRGSRSCGLPASRTPSEQARACAAPWARPPSCAA